MLLPSCLIAIIGFFGCIERTKDAPSTKSVSSEAKEVLASRASLKPESGKVKEPIDPLDKLNNRLVGEHASTDQDFRADPNDPDIADFDDEDLAPEPLKMSDQQDGHNKSNPRPEKAKVYVNCPSGTIPAGNGPPLGGSQWCETKVSFGSGEKNGPLMKWNKNGVKILEMHFQNGKPNGPMQTFFPDGNPAELKTYRDGALEGVWAKWNKEGDKLVEGSFFRGKKNGRFTYWDRSGEKASEGAFRDDEREGLWVRYGREGSIRSKFMMHGGDKNGVAELYYKNGQLSSKGSYRENRLDGKWIYYYPTGVIKAEGSFIEGKKVGLWNRYRPNGQLVEARAGNLSREPYPTEVRRQNPSSSKRPKDKSGFVRM